MATPNYLTPEDQAFIDAWRAQTAGTSYAKWGKSLQQAPTYSGKLKALQNFYRDAKTPETQKLAIDLGTKWLQANNPGILDENGKQFTPGFYGDIISGSDAIKKDDITRLDKIRNANATAYVNSNDTTQSLTTAGKDLAVKAITEGSATQQYSPAKLATAVNSIRDNAYVKPGTSVDELRKNYSTIIDPTTGKLAFSDNDFQAVANAKDPGAITGFNNKLDRLLNAVVKSTASTLVTADPTATATAKKNLLADSAGFTAKVNALNKPASTTTSNVTDTSTGTTGDTTTTPEGGIKSLKTWHAPQQGAATANSPYSGMLDAMLDKVLTGGQNVYGTPTNNAKYAGIVAPLTQGMALDSLPKPKLTYDTSNPAGITGLGNVSGTLDKLNTQVTSSPSYNSNQIANAKTALDNARVIANSTVPSATGVDTLLKKQNTYIFNAGDYIAPATRARADLQSAATTDPKLAAQLEWSATQDATRAPVNTTPIVTPTVTATPTFTSADYIDPITRANPGVANNPNLQQQIAWSATQDAAKAPVNTGIVSVLPKDTVSQTTMNSNTGVGVNTLVAPTDIAQPLNPTPGKLYTPATTTTPVQPAAITAAENASVGQPLNPTPGKLYTPAATVQPLNPTPGKLYTPAATVQPADITAASATTTAPTFTSGDYIDPATRANPAFANNPALAAQIAWSAQQDAAKR